MYHIDWLLFLESGARTGGIRSAETWRDGRLRDFVSIPGKNKGLSLLQSVQTGYSLEYISKMSVIADKNL
jgi:hypothetical protein